MITYSSGSIFDSKCQILTCPVNCVGVMGAGLALEFKIRFPGLLKDYKTLCNSGRLRIGNPWLVNVGSHLPLVCLFPTKYHWRSPSNIHYIAAGLARLDELVKPGETCAIPALGCGLGGLNWQYVRTIIELTLFSSQNQYEVYPPIG